MNPKDLITEIPLALPSILDLPQLLSICLDRLNDAILITEAEPIDKPGPRIVWANKIFYERNGYTPEEVIGQSPRILQGPKTDKAALAKLRHALENWESIRSETLNYRKDGTTYWNEFEIVPIANEKGWFTHWVSVQRDVTERKLAQEKIKYSEQRFRDVSEAAGEYLWEIDTNMIYTYVSNKSRDVKGYTPAELLGHTPLEFMHPDDIQGVKKIVDVAVATKTRFHLQHRDVTQSGEVLWEEVNGTPFYNEAGEVIGLRGTGLNITDRKAQEEQIRQMAFYDTLTRLPNRRLFNERISLSMAGSKRSGRYNALMFLDLDNFKPLNDVHGHIVGDLLLIEVATRLKKCVREIDTVARFGGDEFVVILNELNADKDESAKHSQLIAEKIRLSVAIPYELIVPVEDQPMRTIEHCCTASIGIAMFLSHELEQAEIMKQADAAMYVAKSAGRNLIRFYHEKN